MAVKNKASILINGKNYTSRLIYPIKYANLLDEQLDEARITLNHTRRKTVFPPLTPVVLTVKNAIGYKDEWEDKQPLERRFVVAADTMEESPVGSGFYNHELYLIEETKILETVIVDSLTFTNDLGKSYIE